MNGPFPIHLQGTKSTPIQKSARWPIFEPQSQPPPTHRVQPHSGKPAPTRINVLRESRLHQTFQAKRSGRLDAHRVGYAVYGPRHGHPVIVIGGYGCTRLVGVMFEELAMRYAIRMVWPERPGYGLSQATQQQMRPLDWAHVVLQLADHLGLTQFSLMAQSVGTVFALAVAHLCPERVVGPIFLISPWVSTRVAQTFKWARRLPAPLVAKTISLALDVIWVFNKSPSTTTTTQHTTSNPKFRNTIVAFEEDEILAALDDEVLELQTDFPTQRPLRHCVRPKHMSLYLAMNKQRLSENHSQGQLCDVMVALEKYHDFGFSYADIRVPVSAVWGDKDGLIPARAIEALANSLRDVRLKILESEGHDLVWKEGVMEWALRGISERVRSDGNTKQKNVI